MKNNLSQKIFDYSVYSICLLVPIFFLPFVNSSYELPKLVLFRTGVLIMLLAYMIKIIRNKQAEVPDILRNSNVRRLIGLFLIIILIAMLLSLSPSLSLWGSYHRGQGLYTILNYFLFFILLSLNFKEKEKWDKAFLFILSGFLLSTLYAVFQYFGVDLISYNLQEKSSGRVFAGLGHPNYLAYYAILIAFPLLTFKKFRRNKIFIGIILACLSLILALTSSRGALIGLFPGTIFFITACAIFLKKKKYLFGLIGLLAIFLTVILAVPQSRFSLQEENLRSVNSRLNIWKSTLEMIEDRIFWGYGLDNFEIPFSHYASKEILKYEDLNTITDRAHNTLLDVTAQTGVTGLLIYFLILGEIFNVSIKKLKNVSSETGIKIISVLSGYITLFFANFFGFSVTIHFVFEAFLLAYLIFLLKDNYLQQTFSHLNKRFYKLGIQISLVIFIIGSLLTANFFPLTADYFAAKAFKALEQKKANEVITNFELANSLNTSQNYYGYLLSAVYLQLKDYEKALLVLDRAGKFSSYRDGYYYFLKAKILGQKCLDDKSFCPESETNFQKAYDLSPVYPPITLEWGKYFMEKGNCGEALLKFEDYLNLIPDYWKDKSSEKARIFYKENPDFNKVFEYQKACKNMIGS